MADADIGYAVTLHVNDPDGGTPTVADQLIAGITSITPPSASLDVIDVTEMASPDRAREFIAGLIDYGEAGFEMNFMPGSAASDLLYSIIVDKRERIWLLTFTDQTGVPTCTFNGYLTGFEPSVPIGDKMTASATIKVTGAPVWA